MESVTRSQSDDNFEVIEAQVDAAVAACDGDLRATVRALIVGQVYLQETIRKKVSAGYERRLPFARLDAVQGK